MLMDDLRGMFYIMLKDLKAYYFKPPNISWGILLPLAFVLAFAIRAPNNLDSLAPGLLGLTLLFGASSMEAIVIAFEQRVGALERLMLAPIRLPALLAGKILGGVIFGLLTTFIVLILVVIRFGPGDVNWMLLLSAIILSAMAFSAMGALVSVAVKEVFEAQTLANFFRFPMIFLGGVFVPVASLPLGLRIVAYALPLTYTVKALSVAMAGGSWSSAWLEIVVLAAFFVTFFVLATCMLARRLA